MNTEWETPKEFFDNINKEFSIDLYVCATGSNAKVFKYFSKEDNGLERDWHDNCWMNPPYDRNLFSWVDKAVTEILRETSPKCKSVAIYRKERRK